MRWRRVHELPDFAYFNHGIHVNKGVGCAACHGRVDEMAQIFQVSSLRMEWCLECHREPERVLRPLDQIYNMAWEPPADQEEQGRKLAEQFDIPSVARLTSCSTCHR